MFEPARDQERYPYAVPYLPGNEKYKEIADLNRFLHVVREDEPHGGTDFFLVKAPEGLNVFDRTTWYWEVWRRERDPISGSVLFNCFKKIGTWREDTDPRNERAVMNGSVSHAPIHNIDQRITWWLEFRLGGDLEEYKKATKKLDDRRQSQQQKNIDSIRMDAIAELDKEASGGNRVSPGVLITMSSGKDDPVPQKGGGGGGPIPNESKDGDAPVKSRKSKKGGE